MDKLSVFTKSETEVSLKSEANNTIDTVVNNLTDIDRELKLTRKGNEAFVYGEEIEDSDEVDLEDIEMGETEK